MDDNEAAHARLIPVSRRLFIFACLLPHSAFAHSYAHGEIAIGHAWALPSNQNETRAFLPLVNLGNERDELVAARSAACGFIELRQNNRYDHRPLDSILLEPDVPVPMRPNAFHLRLLALKHPLRIGNRFPLILDFLNAGEAEIEVMVEEKPGL
jgi:periplasmic copper chaperone A